MHCGEWPGERVEEEDKAPVSDGEWKGTPEVNK